jgi:hypothetical protein
MQDRLKAIPRTQSVSRGEQSQLVRHKDVLV